MSHLVACPHCSTQIRVPDWNTHKTLLCPRCLADVDNPRSGLQIRTADINTDVKREMSAGSIILTVLIGLCVLGIAMAIGNTSMIFAEKLSLAFFSGSALLVLGCIAIIRGHARRGNAGGAVGTVLLVLGTIAAIAIFGAFTCAVGVGESLRHMH